MPNNTNQHLIITFKFRGEPKVDELQPTFDAHAADWLRLSSNIWIVWTVDSAEQWSSWLKPLIGDNDSILVFGIDPKNRSGWAPKMVWDWLNKNR